MDEEPPEAAVVVVVVVAVAASDDKISTRRDCTMPSESQSHNKLQYWSLTKFF